MIAAIAAGTELTGEAVTENDKRFARMETIKKILDSQMKFSTLALVGAIAAGVVGSAAAAPGATGTFQLPTSMQVVQAAAESAAPKFDRAKFSKAFAGWAHEGSIATEFATITTATQSGILLPVEVSAPITPQAINTFRQAYGLWGVPVMSTPTTGEITIPVLNATAGGLVAETASSETDGTPGLTESIVSKCGTYQSGSVYFSNMVLAAQEYDLVAYTIPALSYSKELGLESAMTAAIIADAALTNVTTTAGNVTITVADLEALDQALPKKFQMQKVIMLSATAYSQACGLTFSSGPFVLTVDANGVRRFNGTPVLRNDYFSAVAASAVIGAVISLPGFHLRDAGPVGVTRYTQVPAKPNQTGFNLFAYHAYGYAPSAMGLFKMHS